MKIIVEKTKADDLSILNVFREDIARPAPVILMIHGFNHFKEFHLKDAYYFALRGFYVTLFDAFRHGEAADERLKRLSKSEVAMEMPLIGHETALYFDRLVEYHCRTGIADSGNIGLMGFSFGGYVVYDYLSNGIHPAVKAAVPVISFAPVSEVAEFVGRIHPEAAVFFSGDMLEQLRASDIVPRLRKVADFPLLMLNGDADPFAPIEIVRKTYSEMKANYSKPERIKLVEYPGVGHESTFEMLDEAAKWFEKYLKE